MKLNIDNFDIKQIAESGECFRWNKIADNKYRGIIFDNVCEVTQSGKEVIIDGIDDINLINSYFDLERNYDEIKEFYENDEILKKAMEFGYGIRILNQDKFETLISFIISANNNIPRIKKSVEKISQKYGKKIIFNNEENYAFPTPEELFRATEKELRECGVGFRDKYIVQACKEIVTGIIDLEKISQLETEKAKKELLKITGVGPKVADCILLFSMGKTDAFPIDVWVKKIMENLYIKHEVTLKEIEKYSKEKFGSYAGIAQQYLFYYVRENPHVLKIM